MPSTNEISITKEYLAGASSLDGEELTLALLHENETLLLINATYKQANHRGFWIWTVTLGLLVISLLWR